MSKTVLTVGLVGLIGVVFGTVLIVGPGKWVHYHLHKAGILEPYGVSEWEAKPQIWQSWPRHHQRLHAEGILVLTMSLVLVAGCWWGERALRRAAEKGQWYPRETEQALGAALVILVFVILGCFICL